MATIDIRRSHSVGKDKARSLAEGIADKLKDKLDVTYSWDGDHLRFQRTGAKGSILVTDDVVHVQIDLAFALRPMKGMVEGRVKKYMDESF